MLSRSIRAVRFGCLLLLAACAAEKKIVCLERYDSTGDLRLEYEAYMSRGGKAVAHGALDAFEEDGTRVYSARYDHGAFRGLSAWYPNGNKKETFQVDGDGRTHGWHRGWFENGNRAYERRFEHGFEVGTSTWWNADGAVRASGTYRYYRLNSEGVREPADRLHAGGATAKWCGSFVVEEPGGSLYVDHYSDSWHRRSTNTDGVPITGLVERHGVWYAYKNGVLLGIGPKDEMVAKYRESNTRVNTDRGAQLERRGRPARQQ